LPDDGLQWREQLVASSASPRLEQIVSDLWRRGVPVVPLAIAPAPGFQGMACIAEGRPVVLLGYKNDEPGRVAFVVAHEAGHIAAGDCAADQPVVDEEDEIPDHDGVEVAADRYATRVLVGKDEVPFPDTVIRNGFKDLAREASRLEQTVAADASSVIFSWARRTGDYATANMAVKALYRNTGARVVLARALEQHVDFANATETDQSLLHLCGLVGASNEAPR
jgi:Zn-dependent peptidase ImmA (M78 family)